MRHLELIEHLVNIAKRNGACSIAFLSSTACGRDAPRGDRAPPRMKVARGLEAAFIPDVIYSMYLILRRFWVTFIAGRRVAPNEGSATTLALNLLTLPSPATLRMASSPACGRGKIAAVRAYAIHLPPTLAASAQTREHAPKGRRGNQRIRCPIVIA